VRLVAWNAQCARRTRRSFSECVSIVAPLHPDIVVVSEGPAVADEAAWLWPADSPAKLAVWTRGEYAVIQSAYNEAVPQSAVLEVTGPVSFTLAVMWPVETKPGPDYATILRRALDAYPALGKRERVILAGDLNSSTGVQKQRTSHPKLVSDLDSLGLTSVHHHQEALGHGEERAGTYRWSGREYFLDYAFVSPDLLAASSVAIPRHGYWEGVSDHFPVVLDIPDAAFRASST